MGPNDYRFDLFISNSLLVVGSYQAELPSKIIQKIYKQTRIRFMFKTQNAGITKFDSS